MIYQMKLNDAPFGAIKYRAKRVEMRLNDEKRAPIKAGDFICFTNAKSGEELFVEVKDKINFNSFDQLYSNFDKTVLGYAQNEPAHPDDMLEYYPKEKIEAYGVTAIIIEPVTRKIEVWDLYDKDGKATGITHLRGFPIPDGFYHLAVHAWITDGKGKFLLSRRSATKSRFPLLWECVGGSAFAGENSLQATLREIKEEIGLDLSDAKHRIVFEKVRGVIDGKRHNDIAHIYLFHYEGEVDLSNAESDEVCETKWLNVNQIKRLCDNGELVPTLTYFFEKIANESI